MLERRDEKLNPFQCHHCVSLRILAKIREPTLADIYGPEADAIYEALGNILGPGVEKSRQNELAWYEELQLRRQKEEGA